VVAPPNFSTFLNPLDRDLIAASLKISSKRPIWGVDEAEAQQQTYRDRSSRTIEDLLKLIP